MVLGLQNQTLKNFVKLVSRLSFTAFVSKTRRGWTRFGYSYQILMPWTRHLQPSYMNGTIGPSRTLDTSTFHQTV